MYSGAVFECCGEVDGSALGFIFEIGIAILHHSIPGKVYQIVSPFNFRPHSGIVHDDEGNLQDLL